MNKKKLNILVPLAALLLLLLSSCSFIFDDYPEDEDHMKAIIMLSLDGDKVTTRGGDLFVDDAIVGKVRIIVFDNGTLEKNQLFTSNTDEFKNPFRVQVEPGTKNIYVIANETTNLKTSLAATGLTETGLKAIMADDISESNLISSPLVMTGETQSILLEPGLQQKPVTLKRVAAKINLQFKKDTDAEVKITKVSLLKNTTKSTLWEGSSVTYTQGYWSHSQSTEMTLDESLNDYLTVYVYENLGNSANNKANATQLEVEAIYNGLPSIYRVYVNENVTSVVNAGDPSSSVTDPSDHLYNIKRNYEYNLNGTISALGDFQGLTIFTAVQPWTGENKTYFVGYGYTVEVDGNKVTVSNHDEDCPPHLIKLVHLVD
ncbi:MAG: hypothetical protein GXZ03_03860 [Proteiniphilum sp.]|nr:hypothetical protein [Proteiniphilum sp.]